MNGSMRDWVTSFLAIFITTGYFAVLGVLIKFGFPPQGESHDVVLSLVSSLTTVWVMVTGYYYGNSKGSDAQASTIAKALDKVTPDVK